MKTPLYTYLRRHAEEEPIWFHMPGHKGARLYHRFGYDAFLSDFMNCDITEISGADNLFQAEGVLQEVQDRYSELYEVENSYLQINGTSGGLIAGILASVPKGGKLIMARNCHKSVFNALILGDIQPVYIHPEKNEEYGISGAIPAEEARGALERHPDAAAVILPSPNYYGICSDIQAIAEEVHKHDKLLIVDQAHGAHLKFFNQYGKGDMPMCAESAGADLVVNSTHKTLASMTQSAVLNRVTKRVDRFLLEDKLQCIQSTSPSYILMASLDINAAILEEYGQTLIRQWENNLNFFYKQAETVPNLKFISKFPGFDWSKLNISLGNIGLDGAQLEKELIETAHIYPELFTGELVMCMTGIGTEEYDIQRLLDCLNTLANGIREQDLQEKTEHRKIPEAPPKERADSYQIPKKRCLIPLEQAEGRICANSVIPYPPGIPFLCPGEQFHKEDIAYIQSLRNLGEKVIGVTVEGEVFVGI